MVTGVPPAVVPDVGVILSPSAPGSTRRVGVAIGQRPALRVRVRDHHVHRARRMRRRRRRDRRAVHHRHVASPPFLPDVTVAPARKPVPVMVTASPRRRSRRRRHSLTVGAGFSSCRCSRWSTSPLCASVFVTTTFTAPAACAAVVAVIVCCSPPSRRVAAVPPRRHRRSRQETRARDGHRRPPGRRSLTSA